MYDDVESDYWKEIFVHLQHKNMMRMGTSSEDASSLSFSDKLTVANATQQFDVFKKRNPDISPSVEGSSSYFTWETFVTNNVKVRLFIQNQIKCSLMQNISGDFTKIADAKFPNNPFPELEEFLSKREDYKKELSSLKTKTIRNEKQKKIAYQFIKANLNKKYNKSDTIWTLDEKDDDFLLTIDLGNGNKKEVKLSLDNFMDEIKNL